jgi:SET domain-containing protein
MPELKAQNRDFIRVGKSPIEGTGVFAKRKIPRGTRIIEYIGDHVPINALYHVIEEGKPSRIYGFALNDTTAIDGARNGNDARFFNHGCDPNCEPYNFDGHVYIYAMRDILQGEELTFDYKLGPVETAAGLADAGFKYRCRCGAASCRGTLLAPAYADPHEVLGDTR